MNKDTGVSVLHLFMCSGSDLCETWSHCVQTEHILYIRNLPIQLPSIYALQQEFQDCRSPPLQKVRNKSEPLGTHLNLH